MLFRKLGFPGAGSAGREAARGEVVFSTVIGQHTRFRGEVRGSGALEIRGQVEGSLRVDDRVSIAREGRLSAEVFANELVVGGFLEGEARVQDRLILLREGHVHGNIESGRMQVEEGAILRGTVLRRIGPSGPTPDSQPPDVN